MSFALNLPVYFLFAAILYKICKGDEAGKFYALALGTLLFPMAGTIIAKPTVAPNHAFIYAYLFIEFIQAIGKNHTNYKRILYVPLFLIIACTTTTILNTEGFDPQTFYIAARDFCESYGYLIAAFIAGTHTKGNEIFEKLYKPTIIFCGFAVIEVSIKYNIPYMLICSAYPNYDASFASLDKGAVFIESWRIRAAVTTVHPTALGTVLSTLFAFYLSIWKKNIISQNKLVATLVALIIGMCVSGSRTSMICAVLVTAVFIFSKVNIYLKILLAGVTIISFGTLISLAINHFENSNGSSLDLRREQLLFSILTIQQSPIYGNGVQYTSKYVFEAGDEGSKGKAWGSDDEDLGGLESIIFRRLIDYGFLGLGGFFAFLLYFQFYFLIHRKRTLYAKCGALVTLSFTAFLILSGTLANSIVYGYILLGFCLARTRMAAINHTKDEEALEESEAEIEEPEQPKAITAK